MKLRGQLSERILPLPVEDEVYFGFLLQDLTGNGWEVNAPHHILDMRELVFDLLHGLIEVGYKCNTTVGMDGFP